MKQKVKPVRKASRSKKPAQFAIEMDAKGIGFFLILGLGVAVIVFYLGYTAGKATRDPNAISMQPAVPPQVQKELKEGEVEKSLKIYNIREDKDSRIDALKRSSRTTLSDADRLIAESKKESVARKPAAKPTVKKKADDFTPQWPDNVEKKKPASGLFTWQILSTPDIEKATSRVKHLKQRGFEAYRVAAKVNGKLYYRVRVGRGSKSHLRAIEGKLKKAIAGDGRMIMMRYGQ